MPRRKIVLSPYQLDVIERLAARGHNEGTIWKKLGIGKDSWKRIKDRQEGVQDALERGRAHEHEKLVNKVFEKAMDGDTACLLFLLKTHHGYREGEIVDARQTNNITIQLPGSKSESEYMRTIEHEPDVLEDGDDDD